MFNLMPIGTIYYGDPFGPTIRSDRNKIRPHGKKTQNVEYKIRKRRHTRWHCAPSLNEQHTPRSPHIPGPKAFWALEGRTACFILECISVDCFCCGIPFRADCAWVGQGSWMGQLPPVTDFLGQRRFARKCV